MSELPQFFLNGNNGNLVDLPELPFDCSVPPTEDFIVDLRLQKRERIDSEELWESHVVKKRKASEVICWDFKSNNRTAESTTPSKPEQENTLNEFVVISLELPITTM